MLVFFPFKKLNIPVYIPKPRIDSDRALEIADSRLTELMALKGILVAVYVNYACMLKFLSGSL
jgi:hypothetical protein